MTKIFSVLTLVLLTCAFSGCGEDGWSEVERNDFMKSCMADTPSDANLDLSEYCQCMLDKLENDYDTPEDADTLTEDDLFRISADCIKD